MLANKVLQAGSRAPGLSFSFWGEAGPLPWAWTDVLVQSEDTFDPATGIPSAFIQPANRFDYTGPRHLLAFLKISTVPLNPIGSVL
jgi:hypothetical protein